MSSILWISFVTFGVFAVEIGTGIGLARRSRVKKGTRPLRVRDGHASSAGRCLLLMLWTAPPPARECHECGRC